MSNSTDSVRIVHGQYFPHIDGIRALAVVPVVSFHMLDTLCPGGFAGVDVFFVISGYLITGGIFRDLDQGRFTILDFYHRRIRRILPAYFVLIAGVFFAGCVLYHAKPLVLLGDAVVAGTLFLANLHFAFMAGDYFAPTVHAEALLHLWSLSVEEQFYVFIPLLCATLWKFSRRLLAPVLGLLAAISLSGAIYSVMIGKQNDAFYFLHYRAWELLAGSLLAMLPGISRFQFSGVCSFACESSQIASIEPTTGARRGEAWTAAETRYSSILAFIGLFIVLSSYAGLSSKTRFPGAAALAPVSGTILLIRFGHCGWVSRLLSCRAFVLTGRMSYSLYLWHWPVIVFWRYVVYDQPGVYDYVGMFSGSILLGYLSWRFVELPVRISSAWAMRQSFAFAAIGITTLVAIGTACVFEKGWPSVLHPEANQVAYLAFPRDPFLLRAPLHAIRYVCSKTGLNFKVLREHDEYISQQFRAYFACGIDREGRFGSTGQPEVFLLGDSHAGHLRYGLDALLRERGMAGYILSFGAVDKKGLLTRPDVQEELRRLAEQPQVSHVIIAEMWDRERFRRQGKHPDYDQIFSELEEVARYIKALNKTLLIATDIPCYPAPPAEIAARSKIVTPRQTNILLNSQQQSDADYDRDKRAINSRLEEICQTTGAVFVPLHLAFRQDDHYVTVEIEAGKPIPLYRDADHLSAAGSLLAARFIIPYLNRTRRE